MKAGLAVCLALVGLTFALEIASFASPITAPWVYGLSTVAAVLALVAVGFAHPRGDREGTTVRLPFWSLLRDAHAPVVAVFALTMGVLGVFVILNSLSDAPSHLSLNRENLERYPWVGRWALALDGVCAAWGAALASSAIKQREKRGP